MTLPGNRLTHENVQCNGAKGAHHHPRIMKKPCDIALLEAVPLDKIKMTFDPAPGARIEVYEVELLRENP